MKNLIQGALGSIIVAASMLSLHAQSAKQIEDIQRLLLNENGDPNELVKGLMGSTDTNRLFYFPTFDEPATPAKWNLKYEDIYFPSTDGVQLHGWYLYTDKDKNLGTVVFSHGNAGALGHHLGFVVWLAKEGYDVFMYDYRGFGKSAGTLDRGAMIEDVKSAFRYVRKRGNVNRIISYGHSLGGAKSVAALSDPKVKPVAAVVIDGAFASYQEMASLVAGDLGSSLISDDFSPNQLIGKIKNTPLLVVHGDKDPVVPIKQGRQLFEKANSPKTFFEVRGAGHGDALSRANGEYRKKMMDWLATHLLIKK